MIENGFSKVNPSTFSIYQITGRPIEGILDQEPCLVMHHPETENAAF